MKRSAIILTSLFALLFTVGGTVAFAEESETVYPDDKDFVMQLNFSSLSGYAVGDGEYYFTEGNTIYIFDGEILSEYTHVPGTITAIDYDGKVYFKDSEKTYTLVEENGGYSREECEAHTFTNPSAIESSDGIYRLMDGKLDFCNNKEDTFVPIGESYSNLRLYGNSVYAMHDNGVYKMDGATAQLQQFPYFYDYANEEEIVSGKTTDNLKDYKLTFVTVKAGAYMTPVNLNSLDDTFKTKETIICSEDMDALLLCYTGNAAVIAVGEESYILLKSKTQETKINCYQEAEFEKAQITGNCIYASPFSVRATSVLADARDTKVTVVNKLTLEGVLWRDYYEVEYETKDGETATGYVADGLLDRDIISDNKQPSVIPDPDYSESTGTKTVLLILAVVFLVLIAIGYLVHISSGKRKKKKEKNKNEEEQK